MITESARIKFFIGGTVHAYRSLPNVPRIGDEIRFADGKLAIVAQVVWCLDEEDELGRSRINIRCELL